MMVRISIVLVVLTLLAPLVDAAPGKRATSSSTVSQSVIASSTDTAVSSTATVPFASLDPNLPLWNETSDPSVVSAERGKLGASVLGPDNLPIDLQNPDFLAPPTTDSGSMYVDHFFSRVSNLD